MVKLRDLIKIASVNDPTGHRNDHICVAETASGYLVVRRKDFIFAGTQGQWMATAIKMKQSDLVDVLNLAKEHGEKEGLPVYLELREFICKAKVVYIPDGYNFKIK